MRVRGSSSLSLGAPVVDPAFADAFAHPLSISLGSIVVFIFVRLAFGGAPYLPSAAWYMLCFVIPAYVALSVVISGVCIPLTPDWQTLLHCGLVLVYAQLDLLVSRALVGAKHGPWTLWGLIGPKLGLFPRPFGAGDAGVPPLGRTVFEVNGAALHEIFWNVLVCQNCVDHGVPGWLAVCCVPLLSGLVHGIVSNAMQGVKCAPQFFWVALSYHASGSVAPPALIHALWYLLDGKLLVLLNTMRRDWDADARREEGGTPGPDVGWLAGFALMLAFYVGVNASSERWPGLRSAHPHVRCGQTEVWPEYTIVAATAAQLLFGAATWRPVRAMMAEIEGGDFTQAGLERGEQVMEQALKRPALPCLGSHPEPL